MLRFTTFQVTVLSLLLFFLGFGSFRLYRQSVTEQKLQEEILSEGFEALPAPAGPDSGGPIQKLAGEELLALRESMKININTAGVDELNRLPGIGPATAQNIVDHRKENGPFRSIEELVQVKRIGPSLLNKIRNEITVGPLEPQPEATAPAAEAGKAEPDKPARPTPAEPAPAGLVDLNTASAEQLETLPRIGPSTAKAILDHRTRNGPFRSVDDLAKVPRIGPKTVERLRPYVTVGPAGEAAAPASGGPRVPERPAAASRSASKKVLAPGETININEAGLEELARLPGVGPSTAQKILEHRLSSGPFKSIEDIQKIKGIGPAKFAKMKDHLRVQ
jgi:competence protein ComEA